MRLILEEEQEAESDPVHIRTLRIPTRGNFHAGPRGSEKQERGWMIQQSKILGLLFREGDENPFPSASQKGAA